MADQLYTLLNDRALIAIKGVDATHFLQNLITNNIEQLAPPQARHAALLTPQGKILFDFFVYPAEQGFMLDIAASERAEFIKRLGFYKLRADVTIEDKSDELALAALWSIAPPDAQMAPKDAAALFNAPPPNLFPDPRFAPLGYRLFGPKELITQARENTNLAQAPLEEYHAFCIGWGIAEGAKDYSANSFFPHEVNFDQLHGVDFKKGCYVGQEVVSRMHHKTEIRKRLVPIETLSKNTLPGAEADILAGDAKIGTLIGAAQNKGIAVLRLDRAAKAYENNLALYVDEHEVQIVKKPWMQFSVPEKQ